MTATIARKIIIRTVLKTYRAYVEEKAKQGYSVAGSIRKIVAQVLSEYGHKANLSMYKP